jgi:hypothetical protein
MSGIPIIGDVIDAVGDVIEFVGDVVEEVVEVVVDVAKYVAENPEVLIIAVAAPQLLPSIGVTGMAIQPVTAGLISASQGGDLEDIGKAALGSFAGQAVGIPVAKGVGNVVGTGNPAQVALANFAGGAAGGAAGAVATGQDVGEAAVVSGLGSASASLARSGAVSLGQQPKSFSAELAADIGEAAGRTAAGGDFRQELAGAAFSTLDRESRIALEELKSRPQTERTKQIIAAFSEPRSPGVGTQLGEATAELGGAIVPGTRTDIEEARRLGIELPESNMKAAVASDRELPEVVVTGSRIDGSDVRTGRTIPSSLPSGEARTAGTAGGVTTAATGGAGAEEGGEARAPEEMTGAELLETAAAGEERERLPEVEVEGELIEEPIDFKSMTDEELIEYLNKELPVTEPKAPEADFKPLDVRPARGSTRRAAPSSISPRVVGTSPTAAIVGEKEPIFGGEEDAQQSVWNTRSLRLRKALGG